ncbi:uncharacterized protein Z519_08129 [Cladophialophora bantiana CBS 173.52]|uniref:DUF2306 domain-containing protein n=1 Tax=Cladophialophora bantiana (strain ATCC 10958 / CBS 173.52 / CDC B-1940 / NIH 8579) TaxID=1442370 RepID=A0A0D2HD41_CLAB1|nr:uncharacterized protein Z519_08129 [Cladophialophora bantiana CBS 173.52]KIW91233.1 hypothetical protein Z519_08129 [Cladophialophora bantiana CBS 173.52]
MATSSRVSNNIHTPSNDTGERGGWRNLFSWLGFREGYNVPLFIVFAATLFGFSLSQLSYLDLKTFSKSAAPGEWYWYQAGHCRVGLLLHLATILPAGILVVFQFVPAIRRRTMLFHRVNGYIVILLILISNGGALMIARRAFGGELAAQAAVGVLVISTTIGLGMAYYNIKKLQVDQHRAWMLRTMFYLGAIITTRIIMVVAALIASKTESYNVIMTCGELRSMHDLSYLAEMYPGCVVGSSILEDELKIIHADFFRGIKEQIAASLRITFGMALWLAFFLHAVGIEAYLALTPREAQRLRMVSYEKQLKAGMSVPGSAGLVVENFGDADAWEPTARADIASESGVV